MPFFSIVTCSFVAIHCSSNPESLPAGKGVTLARFFDAVLTIESGVGVGPGPSIS